MRGADLEEGLPAAGRSELSLELREQRRQEARVDEEFRIVQQRRVWSQAELGQIVGCDVGLFVLLLGFPVLLVCAAQPSMKA